MPLGFTPSGSAPIASGAYVTFVARTFSVKIVDRNGVPVPSGTVIKAAWFDQNLPENFTTPVWKGSLTVQGNDGTVTSEIADSSLPVGGVGWLILSDSDGLPATKHKAFSGPVFVQ